MKHVVQHHDRTTQGTEIREFLYPWHLWFGWFVHVRKALANGKVILQANVSPEWLTDQIQG
jgi:hypothetical protein